jgi:hypothetical protein
MGGEYTTENLKGRDHFGKRILKCITNKKDVMWSGFIWHIVGPPLGKAAFNLLVL